MRLPTSVLHDHSAIALANLGLAGFLVIAVQLGGSALAVFGCGFRAALGAALLACIALAAPWLEPSLGLPRVVGHEFASERVSIAFAMLMVAWGHARVAVSNASRLSAAYQSTRDGQSSRRRPNGTPG
ncbi:MAG: hypothetical protein EOO81_11005 [Oxalobacteraceae bacterium]|nr:MAG: hypothetical protein EOO81_11005 [Oxalobacteraceae bacterium]